MPRLMKPDAAHLEDLGERDSLSLSSPARRGGGPEFPAKKTHISFPEGLTCRIKVFLLHIDISNWKNKCSGL